MLNSNIINLSIEVKTVMKKKNMEVKIEQRAELRGEKLTFQTLSEFLADFAKVNKHLKAAIKHNHWTEILVSHIEMDSAHNWKGGNFWKYEGWAADDCGEDVEEQGFYLQPDLKSTPEPHDMFYTFTLESLTDRVLEYQDQIYSRAS